MSITNFKWESGMRTECGLDVAYVDRDDMSAFASDGDGESDWRPVSQLGQPDLTHSATLGALLNQAIEKCDVINLALSDNIFAATFMAGGELHKVWETSQAGMVVEMLEVLARKKMPDA